MSKHSMTLLTILTENTFTPSTVFCCFWQSTYVLGTEDAYYVLRVFILLCIRSTVSANYVATY